MNRLEQTFANFKQQNQINNSTKQINRKAAFIAFLTAGDPDYQTCLEIITAMPKNGVDIIELGIPFLDPAGDGPTIEAASKRAIENGMNLHKVLQLVADFRKENNFTPIVLMGYYNPIFHYGINQFCLDAKKSGVDGLLVVDLPPEEDFELKTAAQNHQLDFIKLIALTSNQERIKKIASSASGFLYLVSILGITGTKSADLTEIKNHLQKIKEVSNLPVAIGFGIKNYKQVKEIAEIGGDAVVVGSALVKIIEDAIHLETKPNISDLLIEKLKSLKSAI